MLEFYPIGFYGFSNVLTDLSCPVATITLDKENKILYAFDGETWIQVPTPNSYYYFERKLGQEEKGKIYVVSDVVQDICVKSSEDVYFQEGDVIIDVIHGNYLHLIGEEWWIRYSGQRYENKTVENEVRELRKVIMDMRMEIKELYKKIDLEI